MVGSCRRIASAIWSDTRITGSSEFIAPWKTIEIRDHRTCCMPRSVRLWIETTPSRRVEHDLARRPVEVRRQQAEQRQRGRGLAAARLAGQPERLAPADLERDVLDEPDLAAVAAVGHRQVLHVEQDVGRQVGRQRAGDGGVAISGAPAGAG